MRGGRFIRLGWGEWNVMTQTITNILKFFTAILSFILLYLAVDIWLFKRGKKSMPIQSSRKRDVDKKNDIYEEGEKIIINTSESKPQEFIVIHKSDEPSAQSLLDKIGKLANIFSSLAIPILIALGAWYVQDVISKRSVSSEYVQIALEIIRDDQQGELMNWAVELLAENSPTALSSDLQMRLRTGEVQLPVTPTALPDKVIFTSHTVEDGDSLYSIAQDYGISTSVELMKKYGITEEDIVSGNTLIPFPVSNPDYCLGYRSYVVREGDTLLTIAEQFGISLDVVREINNIENAVYITDVICIP